MQQSVCFLCGIKLATFIPDCVGFRNHLGHNYVILCLKDKSSTVISCHTTGFLHKRVIMFVPQHGACTEQLLPDRVSLQLMKHRFKLILYSCHPFNSLMRLKKQTQMCDSAFCFTEIELNDTNL